MPSTVPVMGDGPMKTGNRKMITHQGVDTDGINVSEKMMRDHKQIISKTI